MNNDLPLIYPNWPAPPSVGAYMTTRHGGQSSGIYGLHNGLPGGMNLGDHVGDDLDIVSANRHKIANLLSATPVWLKQIHSNQVVVLDKKSDLSSTYEADAAITQIPQIACAVLTADCLPILFCDRQGKAVGAAHAGWRGLCAGIVEATAIAHAKLVDSSQLVWLGPAIGSSTFEVGETVLSAFISAALPSELEATNGSFRPLPQKGKYLCDIHALARIRLQRVGIADIYSSALCTVSEPAHFYSHRRDGTTGRMASMIWIKSSQ